MVGFSFINSLTNLFSSPATWFKHGQKRKRESSDEPVEKEGTHNISNGLLSPTTPVITMDGPFNSACKKRNIILPDDGAVSNGADEKARYIKEHMDRLNLGSLAPKSDAPLPVPQPVVVPSGKDRDPFHLSRRPPPVSALSNSSFATPMLPQAGAQPGRGLQKVQHPSQFSLLRPGNNYPSRTNQTPTSESYVGYQAMIRREQEATKVRQPYSETGSGRFPVRNLGTIDLTKDEEQMQRVVKMQGAAATAKNRLQDLGNIHQTIHHIVSQTSKVSLLDAEQKSLALEEEVEKTKKLATFRGRIAINNALALDREHKVDAQRALLAAPAVKPQVQAVAAPSTSYSVQHSRRSQKQAPQRAAPASHDSEEVNLVSDSDEEPYGDQQHGEQEYEDYEEESEGEYEEEEEQEVSAAVSEISLRDHSPSSEAVKSWERALSTKGRPEEMLVQHAASNIEIKRKHMLCMRPGEWLNDEVINLYLYLLQERDTRLRGSKTLDGQRYPACHFFSTFFYNKLYKDEGSYNYKNVARWTIPARLKSAGQASTSILDCNRIILPVHQGVHWVAAMINITGKEVVYMDSMGGEDREVVQCLLRYVQDEAKAKKQQDWDTSGWKISYPKNIPRQKNGCDCGVFTVMYADYCGKSRLFDFDQGDMQSFRVRIVHDLIRMHVD